MVTKRLNTAKRSRIPGGFRQKTEMLPVLDLEVSPESGNIPTHTALSGLIVLDQLRKKTARKSQPDRESIPIQTRVSTWFLDAMFTFA